MAEDNRDRLAYIEGLRGSAVLAVVIFHASIWAGFTGTGSKLLTVGGTGVDLFFVISGFCMMWTTIRAGEVRSMDVATYLRRRALRIVPPYYVALAITIVVSYIAYRLAPDARFSVSREPIQDVFPAGGSTVGDVAAHATFAHGFFNQYAHSIDGAFWSLSTEWQFYIVLPPLVLLARAQGIWSAVLATAVVSVASLAAVKALWPGEVGGYVASETILARLFEFGVGILAAAIAARIVSAPTRRRIGSVSLPAAIVAIAVMAVVTVKRPDMFLTPVGWALAYGLLVIAVVRHQPGMRSLFEAPALRWVGVVSYSVYLVHGSVFRLEAALLSTAGVDGTAEKAITWVLGPIASLAAGWILYTIVETRAVRWSRRRRDLTPAPA